MDTKIQIDFPFPQVIEEKFRTTKMPVLKQYKNPFISLFNWEKAFANLPINEKFGLLNNTLLTTLNNTIYFATIFQTK